MLKAPPPIPLAIKGCGCAVPRVGREALSLHPLGDQLERGLLAQSANQTMMAASATKRISRMIRCMATSRQKIPLPHMVPEDKDSAYAVLWP